MAEAEEETLIHAAKRVIRNLKIDEGPGGGLLSQDTIKAVDRLREIVLRDEARASP